MQRLLAGTGFLSVSGRASPFGLRVLVARALVEAGDGNGELSTETGLGVAAGFDGGHCVGKALVHKVLAGAGGVERGDGKRGEQKERKTHVESRRSKRGLLLEGVVRKVRRWCIEWREVAVSGLTLPMPLPRTAVQLHYGRINPERLLRWSGPLVRWGIFTTVVVLFFAEPIPIFRRDLFSRLPVAGEHWQKKLEAAAQKD